MPVVDLKELQKKAEKKEKENPTIQRIRVDDRDYFKGPELDDVFDDYGECISHNEEAARLKLYKKMGLNEFGQSAETVERAKKVKKLIDERSELLEEVRKLDVKISLANRGLTDKPKK